MVLLKLLKILKSLFFEVFEFITNNFELFQYINIAVLVMSVLLMFALKASEVKFMKSPYFLLKDILRALIVITQVFWLSVSGYIFWTNYESPTFLAQFPDNVQSDTRWVKNDIMLYYINENKFNQISLSGRDHRELFVANDPIREYHFSPDGTFVLIVTHSEFYLFNLNSQRERLIDAIGEIGSSHELKGSISGIRWAPDSQKFCYEMVRWSRFATKEDLYVYFVGEGTKRSVKSGARKISAPLWDQKGENLYYLKTESRDSTMSSYPFEVRVFKIPLGTLTPEIVTTIPTHKSSTPLVNLSVRGIEIFRNGNKLTFNRLDRRNKRVSERGTYVGIDRRDFLYYVKNKWFRKRLFKIPRHEVVSDSPRFQYKGGDLTVKQIHWLPGGRYLLLHDKFLGPLVLEPKTGNIGQLIEIEGDTIGWYSDLAVK